MSERVFSPEKPAAGTPAPTFVAQVLDGNPKYIFDTVAGRPVVLFFMGSATHPKIDIAHRGLVQCELFDDHRACFFGVSIDPRDVTNGALRTRIPGLRYILDHDRAVSTAYGACVADQKLFDPYIMVLDRRLRVAGKFGVGGWEAALELVRALGTEPGYEEWAPVLSLPRVFDPTFCRTLIDMFEADGGEPSGFMVQAGDMTVRQFNPEFKTRRDFMIEDPALCKEVSGVINQRLRPAVRQAFNFDASRMERYLVACYDSVDNGKFRPHRDNTTKGTAHRRFAVTINLNDDYEGGDLRFPEFGSRTYRAEPGGAIVFGCGLLHEATPVTRGKRYAFLPFLYDDEAARVRKANNAYLGEDVPRYEPRARRATKRKAVRGVR